MDNDHHNDDDMQDDKMTLSHGYVVICLAKTLLRCMFLMLSNGFLHVTQQETPPARRYRRIEVGAYREGRRTARPGFLIAMLATSNLWISAASCLGPQKGFFG